MNWLKCTKMAAVPVIRNKTSFSFLCLLLAACQPIPLPPAQMQANKVVYEQIEPDAYLRHKLVVDHVDYEDGESALAPLFRDATDALSDSLAQGGYLATSGRAHYSLSATIKDIKFPRCLFGSCETGAAVYYRLTDNKRKKLVYEELLVVPYTGEYPLFGANMTLVQRQMLGAALGENFAHLIHVLSLKKQKDLQ